MIRWFILLVGIGLLSVSVSVAESMRADIENAEQAFETENSPANVYFEAEYSDENGGNHLVKSWRVGKKCLRRITDDNLDVVVNAAESGDYTYSVIDKTIGVHFTASRTSLYNMGMFLSWNGLAHLISLPDLRSSSIKFENYKDYDYNNKCRWIAVRPIQSTNYYSEICWDRNWGLPRIIRSTKNGFAKDTLTVKTVREIDNGSLSCVHDSEGLFKVDLDRASDDVD